MSSDLFDFNRGVPENHDEVVAFLSDHFLVEETMNVALRLTKEEFVPFVEEVVVNCLSSGYTVLARDKDSGQIAGLVLNTVWRRADGAHASQATKRPLRPTASQAIEKTSSLANQCLMTKKGYTELMSIPFASVIDAEGKPLVVPEDGTARNVLFFKIVE